MLVYFILGIIVGGTIVTLLLGRKYLNKRYINQNSNKTIDLLFRWITLKQSKKNLQEYFSRRKYDTIAIYGMDEMGKALYDELSSCNVRVLYGIDKGEIDSYKDLKIININMDFKPVDIIIVSNFIDFFVIENVLKSKVKCKIVPIDDVIYEVY